ncbi:MAG TPA: L-2-hydroxyglutarate oxidase [Longimicrobiales bacterium]|nr:L-2-hydroxyglutarate oxidase [Longimicrobiales bacterium]
MRVADVVVVGGGVVGLAIATAVRKRWTDARVTLLEKERDVGLHASTRNSGVLHAGFYYAADSLKARLTRQGRDRLAAFCDEHGIPVRRCGKLVVARNQDETATLEELARRGATNGVPVELVTEDDARRIEPRARTHGQALFSPTTASVEPAAVVAALAREAERTGVEVRTGVRVIGVRDPGGTGARQSPAGWTLRTTVGDVPAGYVINAAGLYADRIAHAFGFGRCYRILPFRGVYLHADGSVALSTHVYPVPDLRNPFLGVHFTVTAGGHTKIGPTAMPALWREHYGGVGRFNAREMVEVVSREALLLARNDFGFRALAAEEVPKYFRAQLVRRAAELVPGIHPGQFREWGRPGIRAQLLDTRTRRLEMDFVFHGDARSFHVLNAVSPAFTCCLSFADFALERAAALMG